MDVRLMMADEADVRDFLERHATAVVARRGEMVDARSRPAVVGYEDGAVAGVLTYDIVRDACEVLTLHVERQWGGLGTWLLTEAARAAVAAGCSRFWVVTTNDNVDALRFYQRRGFRLSAVRFGAIDVARRALKPQIPPTGSYGIPIRDEIELSQDLPLRTMP
jgi:ribosomal protein S18 acetylase RimI-like enzyme